MTLFVVHSHFRMGGVRRVIELALPDVIAAVRPGIEQVVLLGGEAPDSRWIEELSARLLPARLRVVADSAFGYSADSIGDLADRRKRIGRRLRELLDGIGGDNGIVWFHNASLARNPLVVRQISHVCMRRKVTLVLHHHDWWFDNRGGRWREIRGAGPRSVREIGRSVLPAGDHVRHVSINRADAVLLRKHFPGQTTWCPNPADPTPVPAAAAMAHARSWLAERLGTAAPVWLVASRLLRRKNLGESLLLTRWLRPDAWLATTGGVSSRDEQEYADTLDRAAKRYGWPVRFGILRDESPNWPKVSALMRSSEAVLLTSLIEGFGLPFLEATSAGRPLVARSLPNVDSDLSRFGFRFSHRYDEVWIAPGVFDWDAEWKRQDARFRDWIRGFPRSCRHLMGVPAVLATEGSPSAVPFSRLTLAAQLEVLSVPPEDSWRTCALLNPRLAAWRESIGNRGLRSNPWPASADRWLSPAAFGLRFARLLRRNRSARVAPTAGHLAQMDLMREKLASRNLYPLLWTTTP